MMAVTAQLLKNIMAEARPIIERQMNDARLIAGFRDVVASNGGDWGALKALIKAHVEDENDETGEGKRVQKIRDKADSTSAYADMLGLANMNENNFSADGASYAEATGREPDNMDGFVSIPFVVEPINSVKPQGADVVNPQPTAKPAPAESMGGTISAPIPDEEILAFLKRDRKPLRPNCLNPDLCAGSGSKHCYSCLKARDDAQVPA